MRDNLPEFVNYTFVSSNRMIHSSVLATLSNDLFTQLNVGWVPLWARFKFSVRFRALRFCSYS